MTDRKKPGVAFWATVVVVVALVGYPLSFGPACWLAVRRQLIGMDAFFTAYDPIRRLSGFSPPFGNAMDWYANVGLPDRLSVTVSGGEWTLLVGP